MNRVLNATVQRTADHAAPEITLDPLEIVGGMHDLFTYLLFPISYHLCWIFAHVLSASLAFVLQVRSDHQRTRTSARQHASCRACRRPSSVWNWPVEETRPMPLTSASLERKFMAQVRITSTHFFLYCLAVFYLSRFFFSNLTAALMNLSPQVAPSDISYGRCVRSYRVLLFPCCSRAPVLQPTVTR